MTVGNTDSATPPTLTRAEREKRARLFVMLFATFSVKDALCIWTALYPEED